jgi:hypothetical protein
MVILYIFNMKTAISILCFEDFSHTKMFVWTYSCTLICFYFYFYLLFFVYSTLSLGARGSQRDVVYLG